MNKPTGGSQQEFMAEGKQLNLAFVDMGINGEGKAEKRVEFEKQYYKEVEALFKATGKKPSQQERQEIINRMKLPFVQSTWFGLSDKTVPAYRADPEKAKVPDAARTEIIERMRKAGIGVTEQRILETYLKEAGSDL